MEANSSDDRNARGAALAPNTRIAVGEDGVYGWRGTVNMWENPTIALLVAKAMGIGIGALAAVFVGILLFAGIEPQAIPLVLAIALGICALMAVLTVIVFLIYRAVLGGSFSADYLMDETGLLYRPAPKEDRITKGVAVGAAVIAAMAGSYGVTAAGIAATNTDGATRFRSVVRVVGIRKHCVIKVSEPFLYNQVYVAPQDYDFVYGFICAHCPKAKCIER